MKTQSNPIVDEHDNYESSREIAGDNSYVQRDVPGEFMIAELIGQSAAMNMVFESIRKVINTSASVLLTGETGTGKSLIAQHLHYRGVRKDRPFIEQNCGAVPETLLESEFFGHKRGAFTGAVANKRGLFELADRGTLFLDEVTEMTPAMQVKLLQVLQDGRFRRVGDSVYRRADVRIIAATNRDLKSEVEKGHFRADLYFRLSVFPIRIPALRERVEDIPLLAEHYLTRCNRKMNKQLTGFSQEALEQLCSYSFPGNIRELENVIEHALILSTGPRIELGDCLPVSVDTDQSKVLSRREMQERDLIIELMQLYDGNRRLIARDMGISLTTLWRRFKKYQMT